METSNDKNNKTVLGMVALEQAIFPDVSKLITIIEEDWQLSASSSNYDIQDNNAVVLQIQDQIVALMFLEVPIPWEDIEPVCRSAYYWPQASETLKKQQAHVIVSIMSDSSALEKYQLLTKVITAVLKLTPALAVYQGMQSLILSPERYLEESDLLRNNSLPISLWVYFGLFTEEDETISGYTYGLNEFDKMELEVNQSNQTLTDIYGFLYNISHYLLAYDPVLKDGETIGMTAEQKVMMTHRSSRYLEETTVIDLDF
ncbi:hypothetical protein BKI52_20730 [marine bacterium AO1-C]|nr:hypothetical protein BKI52_20730 [marine bacterium AO1-C]